MVWEHRNFIVFKQRVVDAEKIRDIPNGPTQGMALVKA